MSWAIAKPTYPIASTVLVGGDGLADLQVSRPKGFLFLLVLLLVGGGKRGTRGLTDAPQDEGDVEPLAEPEHAVAVGGRDDYEEDDEDDGAGHGRDVVP